MVPASMPNKRAVALQRDGLEPFVAVAFARARSGADGLQQLAVGIELVDLIDGGDDPEMAVFIGRQIADARQRLTQLYLARSIALDNDDFIGALAGAAARSSHAALIGRKREREGNVPVLFQFAIFAVGGDAALIPKRQINRAFAIGGDAVGRSVGGNWELAQRLAVVSQMLDAIVAGHHGLAVATARAFRRPNRAVGRETKILQRRELAGRCALAADAQFGIRSRGRSRGRSGTGELSGRVLGLGGDGRAPATRKQRQQGEGQKAGQTKRHNGTVGTMIWARCCARSDNAARRRQVYSGCEKPDLSVAVANRERERPAKP